VRSGVPVVRTVLRPRPLERVADERIAFFGTAPQQWGPTIGRHLEEAHGARVTHVSGALSDRAALRRELDSVDAETFVVELKAAAVDVVIEEAVTRGVRVVLATSDVVPLPGEPVLDVLVGALAAEAVALGPRAVA
jgi:cyclic 2,3-diphosphoglycerate synthetase